MTVKKVLFIATVGQFFGFEKSDIRILQNMNYEVHCAANFTLSGLDDFYVDGIIRHQIDFLRNPFSSSNLTAYRELEKILKENCFEIIHCHTPVGGVLGRIVAQKYRKTGTKVIYTAHGFHFFKGAPLKNWISYFPVEWILAHWTDVLITINREDYQLAQKHMHARQIKYIPGVGIDTKKFSSNKLSEEKKLAIRKALDVAPDEYMLLSVGELTPRKNHEIVIRALALVDTIPIKYFICGTGELYVHLQKLIDDLKLTSKIKLLGFRTDISDLCECANLFVFPSLQEGLPVALMEAIASETPVICSDIRGNRDLAADNALFDPYNIDEISGKIIEYLFTDKSKEVLRNYMELKKFDLSEVQVKMNDIYFGGGKTS